MSRRLQRAGIASGNHNLCTMQAKRNKKWKRLLPLSSVPTGSRCLLLFPPVILLIGHRFVRCSNLEDGKGGAEEEKQTVRRNRSELTECLILFSFPFLSLLPWIHILVPTPLTGILHTSGWAAGSAWADRSLASHEVGLKETS